VVLLGFEGIEQVSTGIPRVSDFFYYLKIPK